MKGWAKEVCEIANSLGFTLMGYDGGGHIVLRCPRGEVRIPATPSEYRGRKNAIAQLERVSGRKLPRVKAGRGRREMTTKDEREIAAARARHEAKHGARLDEESARRAKDRAAELERIEQAKRAAADDRRRREIEQLMRP